MKIISKYKDYYDYLAGIYGIDSKLVLDRTLYTPKTIYYDDFEKIVFFICDYAVEGMYYKDEFLYGKEIEPFAYHRKGDHTYLQQMYPNDWVLKKEFVELFKDNRILKKPTFVKVSPNTIFDCPILIQNKYGYLKNPLINCKYYSKFPILKQYAIKKVFSADQIWKMLSEWLGKEKPIVNKATDKEKIVSKGFDLKTSFRNVK